MAKTVYIVFDTELEKVIGVYDNPEAADDCENAAPGDRYTEVLDIMKNYDEDEDPRVLDDFDVNSSDSDDETRVRDSYDDEEFYETDDNEEKDPYGD